MLSFNVKLLMLYKAGKHGKVVLFHYRHFISNAGAFCSFVKMFLRSYSIFSFVLL
jgi:hypothetical protein